MPGIAADYDVVIIDGAPRVSELGRAAILASEYHRTLRDLSSSTAHRRRDLEKRLGNVKGAITKAVDALLNSPSRALRERLAALEAQRDEIEATIADAAPPAVEFHPNAANAYRDKVRNLKKTLADSDEDSRLAAHEAIREIVEKVVIHPRGAYKPVEVEITASLRPSSGFLRRHLHPRPSLGGCWLRAATLATAAILPSAPSKHRAKRELINFSLKTCPVRN